MGLEVTFPAIKPRGLTGVEWMAGVVPVGTVVQIDGGRCAMCRDFQVNDASQGQGVGLPQ